MVNPSIGNFELFPKTVPVDVHQVTEERYKNELFSSFSSLILSCMSAAVSLSSSRQFIYRFIYFDVRGVGELCRYTLAVSGFEWQDLRYPMKVAAHGFSYGPEFRRDVERGAFAGNFHKLPLLQVVEDKKKSTSLLSQHQHQQQTTALMTLGQSHAIARFVANQHESLMGNLDDAGAFERSKIDAIYENCRDIKSSWYRIKKKEDGKRIWFDCSMDTCYNAGDEPVSLKDHLDLLEKSLEMYGKKRPSSSSSSEPWCLGGSKPTLADIAIYDMLGTPVSPISGSTCSFFDGERDGVLQALKEVPRVRECIEAFSELEAVKRWETKRPDTFT